MKVEFRMVLKELRVKKRLTKSRISFLIVCQNFRRVATGVLLSGYKNASGGRFLLRMFYRTSCPGVVSP